MGDGSARVGEPAVWVKEKVSEAPLDPPSTTYGGQGGELVGEAEGEGFENRRAFMKRGEVVHAGSC